MRRRRRGSSDPLLVAGPVEHDHGDVAGSLALALGDLADDLLERLLEAEQVGDSGPPAIFSM